jgi:hypothetical protein
MSMTTRDPKGAPPDNVIALSRYRAQLGRGKKLRRADALMESPDPGAAIRALPGDELYYIMHESGAGEALDVLVHATGEQLQSVLDFALWERDDISPVRLAEWLDVLAEAPFEKIGPWVAAMDVELFGFLLLRTATIYDLSEGEAPYEPEGIFYPTPDRLFVLDVRGLPEAEAERAPAPSEDEGDGEGDPNPPESARAMIRLIDNLYRSDRVLARRLLVGTRAELPSQLQEMAYRWRAGRMADLGFADPWEALEVYRELDPASVHIGADGVRVRPVVTDATAAAGDSLRAPLALIERLGGSSPFARAVSRLASSEDVAELHFALVAVSNRALAADRVTPGDDPAVAAVLERLQATLDIAVEFLARGDEDRAVEAVRTVPLMRLHRLGVSLVGKVRKLALALQRRGPFGALGPALLEENDAAVLDAVTQLRPLFPRLLDEPPRTGERPFASVADIARATAAVTEAGAAQALLFALGVRAEHLTPEALGGTLSEEAAAVDAGVLGRTALVARLLEATSSPLADRPMSPAVPFRPLTPAEVAEFEALTRVQGKKASQTGKDQPPMKLTDKLKQRAKAILEAVSPAAVGEAAGRVADRWIAGLAPLEPVLVRKPPAPRRGR